ncbi:DEAD/DEAH box helicase family protein [Mordavella massiliensis]|uniref:DEAD/DEAH box helicase n=1 Tax=Mordavella massiliensis TaxID=1871024 RepID=UPI002109E67E|nr:AAA family ATPase [Mordavella massiliensis]
MNKSNSLFYTNIENRDGAEEIFAKLEEYAEKEINPVYIINRPLEEKSESYGYEKGLVVLIPKHKIMFINYGNSEEKFEDFYEDFIEDLGQLSKKYDYMKILGRPRQWKNDFTAVYDYRDIRNLSLSDFLEENKLQSNEDKRKGEFLISLLTGSINDVGRTGTDCPETVLEKIRRKIILFDGDQTRFIFDEPHKDKIIIQGLAGTGKTELLLHKIKELYLNRQELKLVFTCHNKILVENLRERIPEFFDFMKVDEQIKWNEKLWVMSGWGSKSDPNSGVYSYICSHYNIPFERYSYNVTFDDICKRALQKLNELKDFEPCFDYILIDESQDFTDSFFDLCKKVTRNCLYIAGDIFQNIFKKISVSEVNPDFLLNKCYRTDPKTLMCAHAIGMGLFTNEPESYLSWLDDKAWEACGYDIEKAEGFYNLYRKPLRRFEDLGNTGIKNMEILSIDRKDYIAQILNIIEELRENNPTLRPDDIGIMFLENTNENYQLVNLLQAAIEEKFSWDVNIGYESKEKRKGAVFVSNRNNVKGLEFPFVICLMQNTLDKDLQNRNAIYMMLTRSFITSYFIIPNEEKNMIEKLKQGVNFVNKKGFLHVKEPNEEQKKILNNAIINENNIYKSQHDIVEEIMNIENIEKIYRNKIHNIIKTAYREELDYDRLYEIIKMNYSLMN